MKKWFSVFISFCCFIALASIGYYFAFGYFPLPFKHDISNPDLIFTIEILALFSALSLSFQLEDINGQEVKTED